MNRADLGIRSRGSCGDSDDVMWLEPVLAEIERSLHVINARTMLQARVHQLSCVVAVDSTDDDDHVGLSGECDRGRLPLFGWLADRVDESDVGLREALPD